MFDIDVIWIYGYGWLGDKGGFMFYGDMVGVDKVFVKMEELVKDDLVMVLVEMLKKFVIVGGKFVDIDCGGLKIG